MKRTLIITMEYPPQVGGIATYVDQMAGSFDPQQVVLLAPPHEGSKQWDKKRPFLIIRSSFLYPKFIWPRWLKLYKEVKHLVRTYGIEQIHLHHILPVGYVANLLFRKFKIPYLVFSHGTDISAVGATKKKKMAALKIAKQSARVIVNSNNLEQRLLTAFPALEGHTSVLYPSPSEAFSERPDQSVIDEMRAKYGLQGKHVMLTISRFVHGKGFQYLVPAVAEILTRVPHLVWFVVGNGEEKQKILADIRKHNLQNIVRFIGEVPHEELQLYYHLADQFVLLTHPYNNMEEGLGLVFLEAASAGLPIVAGKSGGVEEAVKDGVTGVIVDVLNNPQRVVEEVVSFFEDKEKAHKYGEAGKKRMAEEFVWDVQLERIKDYL